MTDTLIPVRGHRFAADRALALVSLKRRLAYKTTWLFSIVAGGWQLLIGLVVWENIIGAGTMGGYDWEAMRAYLIIGFVTSTLAWGGADWVMAGRILDGLVAIDLTKPVDFQRARAAEYIGGMASVVPSAALGAVAAWFLFDPRPPVSPLAAALTVVSILLIFPLAFELGYLSVLLCFWTRRYLGIQWAKDGFIAFFSGLMVPVALMPGWLQSIAWSLPAVHITTTPASIYLGRVDALGALGLIAVEAVWVAAMWIGANATNFWLKGNQPVLAFLLIDLQNEIMRFPLTMFPLAVRMLLTFGLPLAMASFIPVQILTGRADPWWLVAPPLAAVAAVAFAIWVFRSGLRAYDSAGN